MLRMMERRTESEAARTEGERPGRQKSSVMKPF